MKKSSFFFFLVYLKQSSLTQLLLIEKSVIGAKLAELWCSFNAAITWKPEIEIPFSRAVQGADAVIFCYNLVFITSARLVGLDGVFSFRGFLGGECREVEDGVCSKKKGMD